MTADADAGMRERRLARLIDELRDVDLLLDGRAAWHRLAIDEVDYALRPTLHERRVPSYGAIIEPTNGPAEWTEGTTLDIELRPVIDHPTATARQYADGVTSWLLRRTTGDDEWALFDRPAGSERDLVVLAESFAATIVQRHPSGVVRVVTSTCVFRWDGIRWQHQQLVPTWMDVVSACAQWGDHEVFQTLLEFAVHDLGAQGIGATLVYRPDQTLPSSFDRRLPRPPPLRIMRPADLAPLRHVLGQIDGAALFDAAGTLTDIGVRLVPTVAAEAGVAGYRGTRHTSGRRYSFDDPAATVIVVSEDGPVTVMRAGKVLGASTASAAAGESGVGGAT